MRTLPGKSQHSSKNLPDKTQISNKKMPRILMTFLIAHSILLKSAHFLTMTHSCQRLRMKQKMILKQLPSLPQLSQILSLPLAAKSLQEILDPFLIPRVKIETRTTQVLQQRSQSLLKKANKRPKVTTTALDPLINQLFVDQNLAQLQWLLDLK